MGRGKGKRGRCRGGGWGNDNTNDSFGNDPSRVGGFSAPTQNFDQSNDSRRGGNKRGRGDTNHNGFSTGSFGVGSIDVDESLNQSDFLTSPENRNGPFNREDFNTGFDDVDSSRGHNEGLAMQRSAERGLGSKTFDYAEKDYEESRRSNQNLPHGVYGSRGNLADPTPLQPKSRSASFISNKSGFNGVGFNEPILSRHSSVSIREPGLGDIEIPHNHGDYVEIPIHRTRTTSAMSNRSASNFGNQGELIEIPIHRVGSQQSHKSNEFGSDSQLTLRHKEGGFEVPIEHTVTRTNRTPSQKQLFFDETPIAFSTPAKHQFQDEYVQPKPRSRRTSFASNASAIAEPTNFDVTGFGGRSRQNSVSFADQNVEIETNEALERMSARSNSVMSHASASGFHPSMFRASQGNVAHSNEAPFGGGFGDGQPNAEGFQRSSRANSVASGMEDHGDGYLNNNRRSRLNSAEGNVADNDYRSHSTRDVGNSHDEFAKNIEQREMESNMRAINQEKYSQHRLSKLSIHTNNDEFFLVGGHPPITDGRGSVQSKRSFQASDFSDSRGGTWKSNVSRQSTHEKISEKDSSTLRSGLSSSSNRMHSSSITSMHSDANQGDVFGKEIVIPDRIDFDRPSIPQIFLNSAPLQSEHHVDETDGFKSRQSNFGSRQSFHRDSTNTIHRPTSTESMDRRTVSKENTMHEKEYGANVEIPLNVGNESRCVNIPIEIASRSRVASHCSMGSTTTEDHLRLAYEHSRRLEEQQPPMPAIRSRAPSQIDFHTSQPNINVMSSGDHVYIPSRGMSVASVHTAKSDDRPRPLSRTVSLISNASGFGGDAEHVAFADIPVLYSHPDDKFDGDVSGDPFRPTSEHKMTPMSEARLANRKQQQQRSGQSNQPISNSKIYATTTEMTVPISIGSGSRSTINSADSRSRLPSFSDQPVRPLIVTSALTPQPMKKPSSTTSYGEIDMQTPQTIISEPRRVRRSLHPTTMETACQTGETIRLRQNEWDVRGNSHYNHAPLVTTTLKLGHPMGKESRGTSTSPQSPAQNPSHRFAKPLMNNSFERSGHPAASVLNNMLQGRIEKERDSVHETSACAPYSSQSNSSHQVTIVQQSMSQQMLHREKFQQMQKMYNQQHPLECKWNSAGGEDNTKYGNNKTNAFGYKKEYDLNANEVVRRGGQADLQQELATSTTPTAVSVGKTFTFSTPLRPSPNSAAGVKPYRGRLGAASTTSPAMTPAATDPLLVEIPLNSATNSQRPSWDRRYDDNRTISVSTDHSSQKKTPSMCSGSARIDARWTEGKKQGDTIRLHIPRGRIRDLASVFDNRQKEEKADEETNSNTQQTSRWKLTVPDYSDRIRRLSASQLLQQQKEEERELHRQKQQHVQQHQREKGVDEEESIIEQYKQALASTKNNRDAVREAYFQRSSFREKAPSQTQANVDEIRQFRRDSFDRVSSASSRPDSLHRTSTPVNDLHNSRGMENAFGRIPSIRENQTSKTTPDLFHDRFAPFVQKPSFSPPPLPKTTPIYPSTSKVSTSSKPSPGSVKTLKDSFEKQKPADNIAYDRRWRSRSAAPKAPMSVTSENPGTFVDHEEQAKKKDSQRRYTSYSHNHHQQNSKAEDPSQAFTAPFSSRFSRNDVSRSAVSAKQRSSSAYPRQFTSNRVLAVSHVNPCSNCSQPLQASPEMDRPYFDPNKNAGKSSYYSPTSTDDAPGSRVDKFGYERIRTEDESSIHGKIDRMFDFGEDEERQSKAPLSTVDSRRSRFEKHQQYGHSNRIANYVSVERQRYREQKGEWERVLCEERRRIVGGDGDSYDLKYDNRMSEFDEMSDQLSATTPRNDDPPIGTLAYSLTQYREMQREHRERERQARHGANPNDESTRKEFHGSSHQHFQQSRKPNPPQQSQPLPEYFRSPTLSASHAGQSVSAYKTRQTPAAGEKIPFGGAPFGSRPTVTSTPADSPNSKHNGVDNFLHDGPDFLEYDTFASTMSAISSNEKHLDNRRKADKLAHMIETTSKQLALNELALADALRKGKSMQALSAHRSLLLGRELLRVQREELRRLNALFAVRRPPPPLSTQLKGSVAVSNIVVHLNKNFCQRHTEGASYAFVVLLKCGHEVDATEAAPLLVNQHNQVDKLFFGKHIRFSDLPVDFLITLEVYAMRIPDLKPEMSSLASKCKNLIGPPHRKSVPQTIETAFRLRGRMTLDREAAGDRLFYLDDVAYPLEGTVKIRTQCSSLPNAIEVDYRGFLTMYHTVSNMASWERYWAVLRRGVVFFWKYPDDEQLEKYPLLQIDLTKCTNEAINKCAIDQCPRPHSFSIEILVNTSTVLMEKKRVLLSADSKELLDAWLQALNETLNVIRG